MYLLLAVNNCVKNAFNEYSKVRRALGMQRECCDPFLHSVSVLTFSCAILARLRMPVCDDAEDDDDDDYDRRQLSQANQWRAFIRSENVV